jgi:GrpB-like predicted nucleotidyltransferase (UPF0157 family)
MANIQVTVVKYDPAWVKNFQKIKAYLSQKNHLLHKVLRLSIYEQNR